MIIVQIKEGENLEKSLKAFKKKFDRIGVVKELRLRKVYNKPCVVRRQKKLKAILRQKYIDSLEQSKVLNDFKVHKVTTTIGAL